MLIPGWLFVLGSDGLLILQVSLEGFWFLSTPTGTEIEEQPYP